MNVKKLVSHDSFPGCLLVLSAVFAMILANSPWSSSYQSLLSLPVTVAFSELAIEKPLLLWINDGLMAIFFLLIGLEIKREILDGNLSSVDKIILPGVAAIAGIVFPALVYVYFNYADPLALRGWAIPSATDIAFALGVFSLFSTRLPLSLKLFLLSVAIFDDIGAIIIIALFYSADLSTTSLFISAVGLLGLFTLNRYRVRQLAPYVIVGLIVWVAVLKSGVHATLAGFAIAWFIPLHLKNEHGKAMLPSLEHALHPWTAYLILPVFAFANAGVQLTGLGLNSLLEPVTLGIALGLFIGKQVGIFGTCWLVIKLNLTKLPKGATWLQFYAVCLLCGIGFTMSLFIGSLAFEGQSLAYQTNVKLGVLIGSFASAITAVFILANTGKEKVTSKYNTNALRAHQATP